MKNRDVALMLYDFADVCELLNIDWKPRAYRRAARSIEGLPVDIEKVFRDGGVDALLDIDGVGKGIASKIVEFLKSGSVKELVLLKKRLPRGVDVLMGVQGVGPKKALLLSKKLGIKSVADLERAAKGGKIRNIAGFGVKSEQDILAGLGFVKKSKSRHLLGVVVPVARELVDYLKSVSGVVRVEVGGSLRRMLETIGDIDVLVSSTKPELVMDAFTKFRAVKRVVSKGPTKSSVVLEGGIPADVRVVSPSSFGAAWQYFTGNKDHNVVLRQLAIRRGLKLNEYGLFKNDKFVAGRSEKSVYSALGLKFIEPELRENSGEFEAARKNLPSLVSLQDIKGDLHVHSSWSDGSGSIEDMARAAKALGYNYVGFTDHSKSIKIAGGMDKNKFGRYIDEIDRVQKKVDITILKGAEVDILSDGSLDYDASFLRRLDFVVASVHSGFKSSRDVMTKRVASALNSGNVSVLGHPTGRIINSRAGFDIDLDVVFDVCKSVGCAVEIDGHPNRLDLNGVNARAAIGKGVKLSVSSDAHSVVGLKNLEFGVGQARRGWAQAKDVINTFSLSRVKKFLLR